MFDFDAAYPPPRRFVRGDGSPRYAFVTFVMRDDAYIPGALVFAHALRCQPTRADLVCMVTPGISMTARFALEQLFDHVVDVDEIFIPHKRRQERQDRPFLLTRFNALRAGPDGDLGLRYEKIVLCDADILPLRCFDHLFTLNTPAGILNEDKLACLEYDVTGQFILPPSALSEGRWKWHRLYEPICPHGAPIPRYITDRVCSEPSNMGVNGALLVLQPSARELADLLRDARRPEMSALVGCLFNWPDMQYATLRWSGRWTNIDLRFGSFKGYPHPSVLCGSHFAGHKPWNFKKRSAIECFSRFPDYRLWFDAYLDMVHAHPQMEQYPKLSRLRAEIEAMRYDEETPVAGVDALVGSAYG